MLLCFNRGYVKQMAALPLQVISIGTAINLLFPAAEGRNPAHAVLWALGTRDKRHPHLPPLHLVTHRLELHPPLLLPEVPHFQPQWDVQCSAFDGDGALSSDISKPAVCVWGFFIIPLIKWVFLSLFISFPNESPGWRTCSTWQEIKENFPLCRQGTFVLERKGKAESKFFQHFLLGKAYKSCWQKVYSLLQRSQLGDFFCLSDKKYHANSPKLLGNYRRYAWQIPCHYTTQ